MTEVPRRTLTEGLVLNLLQQVAIEAPAVTPDVVAERREIGESGLLDTEVLLHQLRIRQVVAAL